VILSDDEALHDSAEIIAVEMDGDNKEEDFPYYPQG